MPVAELKPAVRNAKAHDQAALGRSMDAFGAIEAVVLDERTGRLVAGHGRAEYLAQLQAQGAEPPEGVVVDDQGRWCWLVTRGWHSDNDAHAEAAGIALNRVGERGGWQPEVLSAALDDLATSPDLFDAVGWTTAELDDLVASTTAQPTYQPPPPEAEPEPRQVAERVKRGEVWQLGRHRIMCGDCRAPEDVAKLVDGRTVNLAVTSPPYAEQRDYDEASGFRPIPPDSYVEWFDAVQANVAAHLAGDGSWLVNIKPHADAGQRVLYVFDLVSAHVRRWGWLFVDEFCWRDTKNGVPGAWPNRLKDAWEPVFHFAKGRKIKFRPMANAEPSSATFAYSAATAKSGSGSGLLGQKATAETEGMARPSNVIELAATSDDSGHPAAFPAALPWWFARLLTDEDDVVFDPFCGGGSTILAAHRCGRVGLGMELSPRYCDVMIDRWERHTSVPAVRLGSTS